MITYDDINAEWAKDSDDFKNNHDVVRHSQEQYILHQKYYQWYNECCFRKIRLEGEFERLKRDKLEYYNGEMSLEDIKSRGWPLKPKIMAKSEISKYVLSDEDSIVMIQKIALVQQNINYLDGIIKMITYRHSNIKNIIEYEKFCSGTI